MKQQMMSGGTSALLCALLALSVVGACQATEFRSYNGSDNNLTDAQSRLWGAAGTELQRIAEADYRGDATPGSTVDSRGRLPGREISNLLSHQTGSMPNSRGMKGGVWQWGQFLDHDITLTPVNHAETSMLMSPGDPLGVTMIPFSRSAYQLDSAGKRQHVNQLSAYVDGSNVYGSDAARAAALREFSGGRLRTSAGGLLMPTNDMPGLGGLDNANEGPETVLFVGGDVRANEQLGLISMHTLFVREHNRLADGLAVIHQNDAAWDDERIYQTARRVVGAEIQAITYNEFLPSLLGPYAPRAEDYAYDPSVNASIANEFSTAFFRLGHSMLPNEIQLSGDAGVSLGTIGMENAFFTPSKVIDRPKLVEEVVMGLAMQPSQEIDTRIVDGVRNFLFAPDGQMGLDLGALNVQRGRDHGLPDYNTLREAYGLERIDSFDDITLNSELQTILAQAYGSIDNIDPWMGALAEDHLEGASLGPLMAAAMVDQFTRLRDGDRFFYMGDDLLASPDVQSLVDFSRVTMMDLLDWNTSMKGMPGSFFMATAVPEPAMLWLAAVLGVAVCRRRRNGY